MAYLMVGLGGIIGALLRYYLSFTVAFWWNGAFPIATFITNLIGCFVLGWFTTYLSRLKILHPYLITGLGTGLVGSFTTFSTFSVETVNLVQHSQWVIAIVYVLMSLWGGLFMSWLGYRIGQHYFVKHRNDISSIHREEGGQ